MNFTTTKEQIQTPDKTQTQTQAQAQNNALSNVEPLAWLSLGLLMVACLFPESAFAAALTLEETMGKVDTLANGKVKNGLLSIAALGGGVGAAYKGSLPLGLSVLAGVALVGLTMEWISGGMKLFG